MSLDPDNKEDPQPSQRVQKFATLTVCLVPPPSSEITWDYLTKARTQLKDPGLFRWPPHANLLYPFVSIKPRDGNENMGPVDSDILSRLHEAVRQIEPFTVTLERFGTFGGNKRGVLWLYPSSNLDDGGEPVHNLYESLIQQFPECASSREFNPHMTLSHFACLDTAKTAQTEVESWWPSSIDDTVTIDFPVKEIYVLERKGDDGQFLRKVTLGLGAHSSVEVHDPPLPFPKMPMIEEDWVRAERMALKARRNSGEKRGKRGGRRKQRDLGPSRSQDTPEEIAAKRAARKAKREKVLAEEVERESQPDGKQGGRRKQRNRGPSRSTDTPEEIAAKRAARKAEREKVLAEEVERESQPDGKQGGRRKQRNRGPSRSTDTPEEIAAKRAARKAEREKVLASHPDEI
eukprot:CAMPEP_0194260718 /NCGR_PEP_ID=MMETSP0158-20130606/45655_1 /TAXON_ID=33649 /ORGANISM="Thalassionema nitzschioides, Strain L26-B" /LENGTH=403 /DNA_ID=CAMNT_0039000815 /DNA_START=53 /DNA_END=1264 /DNA_ORIENTATION=-